MGSAGTMERSEATKSGITMGNEHAGAGAASSEMSAVAMGSAGTMERSEATKSGITMGNEAGSS